MLVSDLMSVAMRNSVAVVVIFGVLLPSNILAQSRQRIVGAGAGMTRLRRVTAECDNSGGDKAKWIGGAISAFSTFSRKPYVTPKRTSGRGDSKAGKIVIPLVLGIWAIWFVELVKGHP
jgi:hypothetical protein